MENMESIFARSSIQRSHLKMVETGSVDHRATESEPKARKMAAYPVTPHLTPPHAKVCSICKGAGYLRRDVPWGHPDFGKIVECICHKTQRREREQQQLREVSQLETLQRFQRASFDSFDCSVRGVEHAFRTAFRFAARPKGWLVLVGTNGSGKTHLAVSIAKEQLAAGAHVLFQTAPDVLDYLRATFASKAKEGYDQLFARLRDADLLVLDDLGAEQATPWANEKLFQILNHRYNAMLPTVVTSNRITLERLDPRIISRLRDRELVHMLVLDQAEDYRQNTRYSFED